MVPSFDGTIMMKVTRLPASAAKVMKKETRKVSPKRTAPKPTVFESSKSTEPVSESTIKSDPVPSTEDFFSSIVIVVVCHHS